MEKAHSESTQYLELLNREGAGLLERDEEFFTSKEYLTELKLQGYSNWRGPQKGEAKGDREKGGRKGTEKGRGKGKDKEKAKEGDQLKGDDVGLPGWISEWRSWMSPQRSPAQFLAGLWSHVPRR